MQLEVVGKYLSLLEKQRIDKIEKCNEVTIKFGLRLSHSDAVKLVETCGHALKNNSRIEFGEGVIHKLIWEFCDSPYINSDNYLETIQELTEIFYYFKNETIDLLGDDELIKIMKSSFDGKCNGSTELLLGRELHNIAYNLKQGYPIDYMENPEEEECEYEDDQY